MEKRKPVRRFLFGMATQQNVSLKSCYPADSPFPRQPPSEKFPVNSGGFLGFRGSEAGVRWCIMASQAGQLSHPERRSRVRHKVHSPAYVTKDESSNFILPHLNEIVDIAEDGMCFQNSSPLEPGQILKMCLDLSETKTHIDAEGEVVWSNDAGRTGVRFQKISKESLLELQQWLFINDIVACTNHSASPEPAKNDPDFTSDPLEYNAPLLPDHTSSLAAVAAISREAAALGTNVDASLQLISDRALSLTRATGAAIALAGSENMICRASSGSDAPPVGVTLQIGSGFSGE